MGNDLAFPLQLAVAQQRLFQDGALSRSASVRKANNSFSGVVMVRAARSFSSITVSRLSRSSNRRIFVVARVEAKSVSVTAHSSATNVTGAPAFTCRSFSALEAK